jgi:hypothetical protein
MMGGKIMSKHNRERRRLRREDGMPSGPVGDFADRLMSEGVPVYYNPRSRMVSVVPPSEAHLEESAVRRRAVVAANEFRIRALKYEVVKVGAGDDLIVLMLDLDDPHARAIHEDLSRWPGPGGQLGQPPRPGDPLQLLAVSYSPLRELFSPNHRNLFDRVGPEDIRVALLSEGRTLATVRYADQAMGDSPTLLTVQTEADREAGTIIPPDCFPPNL